MSEDYTRILNRQIQKYLSGSPVTNELRAFLTAVNDNYKQYDRDRELLERSLEFTSAELTAANEKMRAETRIAIEKLTENEQILKSINENLSEGIFRVDEKGLILLANKAFTKLFDLPEINSPDHHSIQDFFEHDDGWNSLKSRLELSGVLKNDEVALQNRKGEKIWVLISIIKTRRTDGHFVYDGSIVNINNQKETEKNLRLANDLMTKTIALRKKAEEDLKHALEKERELNEMKSRFISMTSHEFRTPLTVIQSNSELLALKLDALPGPQHEKIIKHINTITEEISRLTRLIDDILLMGRIDSGKIIFNPSTINLSELITELLNSGESLKNEHRKATLTITGDEKPFQCDATLITHAFNNIISNAYKYSDERPAPEVILNYEPARIKIIVQDHGIGIPESEQSVLFDSFFRASNTSNIKGTGLGLVITKQFIELHHGTIHIASKINQGTCVTIELPVIDYGENPVLRLKS